MGKSVDVILAMLLAIALIAMWMRPVPVATESVTATGTKPPTGVISPFELMSENRQALPDQYYRDPF